MRVVLRNTITGLYLNVDQGWTEELPKARSFRHSAEAMDLARKIKLRDLEVLLTFDEPPRNVALPLPN